MDNRITQLFDIKYPIIQAGMVWCSGWKLASAVSNAGGLGLIGAGSMYPEVLEEHIQKCNKATQKPFGVNLPLLYPDIDKHIEILLQEKVKIVFTSAGNPKTWTKHLQDKGVKVVHVISSLKFAKKCEDIGVNAIVAEGFEAGGHNGREETTTFCLLPMLKKEINLPIIGAGGIASGQAMLAAFVLGAEGVQVGSRYAVREETSAHEQYKKRILEAGEGETVLTLKQLTAVRLIKNKFYEQVKTAEHQGKEKEVFMQLLGKGRAKKGIFEGNLGEGELEIGQISAMLDKIQSAKEITEEIWREFLEAKKEICNDITTPS